MRALSSRPRPLLVGLALALAAATTLYSALWMYGVRVRPGAHLGVHVEPSADTASLDVRVVEESTPARRAGLRAGDRILALNDRTPSMWAPLAEEVWHGRPGDHLRLLVERPGAPALLRLDAVLGAPPSPRYTFRPRASSMWCSDTSRSSAARTRRTI
jgi:predicted metalloprotease with PDZ domain